MNSAPRTSADTTWMKYDFRKHNFRKLLTPSITFCLSNVAEGLLPIAYCLLPTAYCLWPPASCLLPGGVLLCRELLHDCVAVPYALSTHYHIYTPQSI